VQPLNGIDSKFRLAILVARRAKQLIGGARKKIDFKSDNPLSVSMEEFRQGKIDFDVLNEVESIFGPDAENLELTAETGPAGEDPEADECDAIADAEAEAEEDAEDDAEAEDEAEGEMIDDAEDSQAEPES
jgi:DNA-directed RNA polymerase subunit omega